MIVTATVLVTALALGVDALLALVEKWVVPKGLKSIWIIRRLR